MPQLTGVQTGTPQSDLFTGELQIIDLTSNTVGAGILNATIDGLAGNDGTRGIVSLTASAAVTLTSRGIAFSDIKDAGLDDDTVTATATSIGFQNQGRAHSYGVYGGSIKGGIGDDVFTLAGTSQLAQTMKGVGVGFATIDGGAFNDRISITGTATGEGDGASSAIAYGSQGAVVRGGSDQDTIDIAAIAQIGNNDNAKATAIGVSSGWVLGDSDRDQIRVEATSSSNKGIAKGASKANIYGGTGEDSISFTVTGTGSAQNGARGVAAGIDNQTVVFGDDGSDVIGISATAEGTGQSDARSTAYGVKSSSVFGGNGNDSMFISATSTASNGARAFGLFRSKDVSAGEGDDFTVVTATAEGNTKTAAYGLFESNLATGNGNDRIIINSVNKTLSGKGGYGALRSQVNAGAGQDSIKIEAIQRAAFDIQDTLIFGGDGDDTIDVGIGSGQIAGGSGNDLAILDYFDVATMTVTAFEGGIIRISGTQTKSGATQNWSQDIFEVEQFQIKDSVYSAESLASTFAV